MAEDKLGLLYQWMETMSAAGDKVKQQHENEYKTIIEYVKSSETKERILAAQLIAKFFKFFPEYEEKALDAITDLCESQSVDVRKHATMVMINICKDCKHLVSNAADILIQLYQTSDASEVNLINSSLTTLLSLNIQNFLKSFFTNFEDGCELVRERALKFLSQKLQSVGENILTKEIEEQLLTYSKKAIEDVTKEEFITLIGILTKLKIAKTNTGQAMIVAVIKSQAELDKEFDVNDKDALDKFLLCTKHTIPLLSQYQRASEYINYICLKILPQLKALEPTGNDLVVLQTLAEMSPHVIADDIPALIDMEKCQQEVYNKLMEYLPMPQIEVEPATTEPASANPPTEAAGDKTNETDAEVDQEKVEKQEEQPQQNSDDQRATPAKKQEADFQFTHIEYLLYTFHQFGRLRPEFYTEELQAKSRVLLGHLSIGCRKYTGILANQLRTAKSEDLKKDENKVRSIALRTTKNISMLVKDLFMKPVQYKTTVLLSCKPLANRESTGGSNNNNNNNNNSNNGNNYNKQGFNRNQGQKNKFRHNYQNDRNKRPRYAR